jgi:hypothetical protein
LSIGLSDGNEIFQKLVFLAAIVFIGFLIWSKVNKDGGLLDTIKGVFGKR